MSRLLKYLSAATRFSALFSKLFGHVPNGTFAQSFEKITWKSNTLALTSIVDPTLSIIAISLILASCAGTGSESPAYKVIFEHGAYPNIYEEGDTFYFTKQGPPPNSIILRYSPTIEQLADCDSIMILDGQAHGMLNIWSPEITRINGKWYIYFEADDGNTDRHQIYVLENESDKPTYGKWELHGPIITNPEWNFGIHPSTIVVNGRQYLLWSGWQNRRAETETQCIYIAEMENPWTLKSPRIMISKPEYEWERQWINPDGTRTAYPIFVNENPEGFLSPDGKNVFVAYSGSGIWTPYHSMGLLSARADSNLLDPASWTKSAEPLFKADNENASMCGTSNITVVHTGDRESKILYQAKHYLLGYEQSYICVKTIGWDEQSMPVFGFPDR